ncbi:hypothetical protein [Spiribacter vilamensis]|uniref:Uncharacterized protein n=1 Tax=Spiribacter vilamensis TaxID=531306 RepID=A0A4Q8D2B4_9GAMM|nr:hypothetical protein [Spiribacter vilamensis]RZU99474.1 hypothetical protein EV698_1766 [Spiribacter vilamensis]TVO61553.1 hypothetical protein FPL09_05400 [Spiribacter vilamensis]
MIAWINRSVLAALGLMLMSLPVIASPPALFPVSQHLPRIVMGEEGRQLSAVGDRIYAAGLEGRSATRYYLLRPGPVLTGDRGQRLGRSSITLGKARLVSPGTPALLRIEQSRREVRPGDYLLAIDPDRTADHD